MTLIEAKEILNASHHLDSEWFIIHSHDGSFLHGLHNVTSELITLTEKEAIKDAEQLQLTH